jgi:CHAT domain-containing protein
MERVTRDLRDCANSSLTTNAVKSTWASQEGRHMLSIGSLSFRLSQAALAATLVLLVPLQDTRPLSAQPEYDRVWQIFLHGELEKSQLEAERDYRRFQLQNPESAAKFRLLEAQAMLWRGRNGDALNVLSELSRARSSPEALIEMLTLEGVALTHLQQYSPANLQITRAQGICSITTYSTCGTVPRARGVFALEQGHLSEARQSFIESLSFARAHRDQLLGTTVLAYIGVVALQNEHYDEAVDWSMDAYRAAMSLGAEDMAQIASGNLGWAYFELGDTEKSLKLFREAEKRAMDLGDVRAEITWLTDSGHVHRAVGDLQRAAQSYHQALDLAGKIDSREDMITALEDLAHVSIDSSNPEEADRYIQQLTPMLTANHNRLDALDVLLAQGKIAAVRRQDKQAEEFFRTVENDPESQTSMRLGSEHELALLLQREGNVNAADRMYRTALATFESARSQLKNEDSKLPFLANATPVYDDYISFLVGHGQAEEALAVADQSRARTLAQGLGLAEGNHSLRQSLLSPRAVALKAGATLLFYWLGERQSWLWTVTPEKVTLFPLPKAKEIVPLIDSYRKTLLDSQDPIEVFNQGGQDLYKLLVAPASKLIRPNAPVMILADGALNQLNFETLLVPGPESETGPKSGRIPAIHYWIEDATLLSAPSLAMLAAAKPEHQVGRSLLLLGNPVSPNDDYPSLPLFGLEMKQIQRRFAADHEAVLTGQQANPAAYLSSNPAQYSYIHFVAHAIASRTDPLDSAIILSGSAASGDSFKLYARDIMQHPIDAKLVTISACYGSGTRSYAGEGLVGLSWAFLRAGAHNTIGALWEVSDDSTPQLMDKLYQGLAEGETPAAALRHAKLDLLHSQSKFRSPFYWAPFQLYTRQ